FFFSSRRRHTRFSRDWSSDVCSSDLRLTRVSIASDLAAIVIDSIHPAGGRRIAERRDARNRYGPQAYWTHHRLYAAQRLVCFAECLRSRSAVRQSSAAGAWRARVSNALGSSWAVDSSGTAVTLTS